MRRYIKFIFVVSICLIVLLIYKFSNNENDREKVNEFSKYLAQTTEETFMSIEGIESVNAKVSYDDLEEKYSIELSLISNRNISNKEIEQYKIILKKTYEEIKLIINGEREL